MLYYESTKWPSKWKQCQQFECAWQGSDWETTRKIVRKSLGGGGADGFGYTT
jgi:hypothetical protein